MEVIGRFLRTNEYRKFGSVIVDQILFSFTSFFTTVILARLLSPNEFADYILLMSVTMFILGMERSLLSQPFTIRLSDYPNKKKSNFVKNIVFFKIISLIILIALSLFLFLFNQPFTTEKLFLFIFFATAFTSFYFVRDILLGMRNTKSNIQYGIWCSVSILILLSSLLIFKSHLFSIFLLITSFIYYIGFIFFLKNEKINFKKVKWHTVKNDFWLNWKIGKWLTGTNIFFHFSTQIYPWLLLILNNKEDIAILGILTSISSLINPVLSALNSYLLPLFAKQNNDFQYLNSLVRKWMIMFSVLAIALILLGAVLGQQIIVLFFSVKYSDLGLIVIMPFINQAINVWFQPYKIALTAAKRTDIEFWLVLFRSLMIFSFGYFMIQNFGLIGVFYTKISDSLIHNTIRLILYRKISLKSKLNYSLKQ